MLPVSYDPVLVAASVLVAIMASFTGLRLASGLSQLDTATRKREIAKAAVALGGGIWSMHFVGMLAVQVPASISYDALATLSSVLVAILVVGLGLMVLHFGRRTRQRIAIAGVLTGLGIVSMHYIGMSAIGGNCVVSFEPFGYIASTLIAIGTSTAALWLAYHRRTLTQIALGAVILGFAVAAMHYTAMIYTRFSLATEIVLLDEPNLTSGSLALVVAIAAFVICGLFLLTAIPATRPTTHESVAAGAAPSEMQPQGNGSAAVAMDTNGHADRPTSDATASRLPYEVNRSTRFISADAVHAVRADGHYTRLYDGQSEVFCPWPISRLETTLDEAIFIRTHRSYLVNLHHVRGFQRTGDKAFCLIGDEADERIPVSRSRIGDVRRALGLDR